MPRKKKSELEVETNDPGQIDFLTNAHVKLERAEIKSNQVYQILRGAIANLELKPGATINERAICEYLGISRTPFREAILRLNAEHLVSVVPNRETRIAPISVGDVFDGQFVRQAIELVAVKMAARKPDKRFLDDLEVNMYKQKKFLTEKDASSFFQCDEEFHQLICQQGSSKRVWQVVHQAKAQLDRVRCLAFPGLPDHLSEVYAEHSLIYSAILSGNSDDAEQAMEKHLGRQVRQVKELLKVNPEYFTADAQATADFLAERYAH